MYFVFLSLLVTGSFAFAQTGTISGTVVDSSGAPVTRAQVKLMLDGRAQDQQTQSAENGAFTFAEVPAGAYRLSFAAQGFASNSATGELKAGEALALARTTMVIDKVTTEVNVTQTQVELAQAQIKEEEKQRFLGVIPNFFIVYDKDAVPLNTRQKTELTTKALFDPTSFVIGGVIAGVWQAQNTHRGFGQGAQGYAKRYGASFADYGTMLVLDRVLMPTLFKQDPRYFYKGDGSKTSRALYAMSHVFICRGDNRKDQVCYSSLLSRFGTGFATNYIYPAEDRDKAGTILRNSAMGLGFEMAGNLFREFVSKKITKKRR